MKRIRVAPLVEFAGPVGARSELTRAFLAANP